MIKQTKNDYYNSYRYLVKPSEFIFLIFYSFELVLKLIGLGLISNKDSYFRVSWNIFDFLIVISFLLTTIFEEYNQVNLNSIRFLRILTPLRSISKVKSLQMILSALISAIPLLKVSIFIMMIFYFAFAVAGLQLFHGLLKMHCFITKFGIISKKPNSFCGNIVCENGYICGKMMISTNLDITNFDTIFDSYLQV